MGRLKTPTLAAGSPQSGKPNQMRRDGARKRVGAYSREGAFALLDKRSAPALFLKRQREALTQQLGGTPTAAEAALIERCCFLMLRVSQLDAKLATGELTEHDNLHFLAWSNALTRALARLGLKGAVSERSPIDPHLAALTAKQREEAT